MQPLRAYKKQTHFLYDNRCTTGLQNTEPPIGASTSNYSRRCEQRLGRLLVKCGLPSRPDASIRFAVKSFRLQRKSTTRANFSTLIGGEVFTAGNFCFVIGKSFVVT